MKSLEAWLNLNSVLTIQRCWNKQTTAEFNKSKSFFFCFIQTFYRDSKIFAVVEKKTLRQKSDSRQNFETNNEWFFSRRNL